MLLVTWLACASRLPPSYAEAPSWPALQAHLPADLRPVGDQAPREVWWKWRDHPRVHMDLYVPEGPPRGTVILVHGGGGHGRLLAPFAIPLWRAGYRVLAPDLPEYGLTRVPQTAKTELADWSALVADLAALQVEPVSVVGMSIGGTVALHAAMRTDAVDAVVVTTLLDLQDGEVLRAVARKPGAVGLLERHGKLLGGLRRRVRRLAPLEDLSSDSALVETLRVDPLLGARRVPLRFFVSFPNTPPPVPVAEFDRAPVLVAHPAADAWTAPALSRPTFEALPGEKAWVDLDQATHLPLEQPGYDQFVAATLDWLDRHASK